MKKHFIAAYKTDNHADIEDSKSQKSSRDLSNEEPSSFLNFFALKHQVASTNYKGLQNDNDDWSGGHFVYATAKRIIIERNDINKPEIEELLVDMQRHYQLYAEDYKNTDTFPLKPQKKKPNANDEFTQEIHIIKNNKIKNNKVNHQQVANNNVNDKINDKKVITKNDILAEIQAKAAKDNRRSWNPFLRQRKVRKIQLEHFENIIKMQTTQSTDQAIRDWKQQEVLSIPIYEKKGWLRRGKMIGYKSLTNEDLMNTHTNVFFPKKREKPTALATFITGLADKYKDTPFHKG